MQHLLQSGKRVVSVAVAAATIAFSVGIAGLIAPSTASAASAGDLVKGSLSTVYYYGYDGMRYTFPNELTYKSWYQTSTGAADFSDVTTISDSALANLELEGNVVIRPGSYFIKITSDPKVYAVSTDGMIHWVESEEVAMGFYGSNWAASVRDVADAFFVDYTVGASLMEATAFDGMLYMDGADYFIAWDGEKRMVSSAGRSANGLVSSFFMDGTGIDDSDLSEGAEITSATAALSDAAQTEDGIVVADGAVSVSLASSTAASASVPDSASAVPVATFALRASEAATIDLLSVSLAGLGDTTNFLSNGVYLYEGGARLTDGKTFNSSTRMASFGALDFDIAAGETRYVTVVVDMDAAGTNSGSFSVSIADADDVESAGDVSGSFPVRGNTMSIVDLTVGSITMTHTGSLTNPTVGQADARIARFNLEAGSAEDVEVQRLTLEIQDAADHSDFKLYQGSELVATGEDIGDDLVFFDFEDAYLLEEGTDRDFSVTADIGGDDADTIVVDLENTADLYAVGVDYGFGVTVTDSYTAQTTTIQGGDVTVVFNGPSSADVQTETENAEFFNFTITAERDVTVTDLVMLITSTGDSADVDLSDIRLVNADTGTLLAGPEEADATTNDVTFTDEFMISAGDSMTISVTADLEVGLTATETVLFTFDQETFVAEDEDGDAITDVVPSTDLAGNTQTVVASGLTVSLSSTPTGDRSYVRGTQNVEVVGYNLAAANGGDVELTDLTVTVYVDEDSAATYTAGTDGTTIASDRITSCSLYDSSSMLIAGPESIETNGDILFQDFSFTIDAGITERVKVLCNLANVAPGTADQFAWEIDAAGDVTARDEDGDAITATASAINGSETMIISVTDAGTLAVTAASGTPDADFVLTGSTNNTVSKFRFDATNEAFTIDRLTITEEQAETMTGTSNSDASANNISLVTISYPTVSGTTATATGYLTGNELTFNSLAFYVAKDSSATLTVMVDVAETSRASGSATSNEQIRMGISVNTTLDDEFRAVGAGSNQTLNDDSLTGVAAASSAMNEFVVRETVPTFSKSSLSPSGTAFAGDEEVLRFNVAAAFGEDVVLERVTFKISSYTAGTWNNCTDLVAGDFSLFNDDSATEIAATWSRFDTAGALCTDSTNVLGYASAWLTTAEVVAAGGTETYYLKVDATGAATDSDTIRAEIVADPALSTFVSPTTDNQHTAVAITAIQTSLPVDNADLFRIGDILCLDSADNGCGSADEKVLVVACTGGAADGTCDSGSLTVVRGYMGSTPVAFTPDAGDDIDFMVGGFVWQDDGSVAEGTTTETRYGAFMMTDAVTGNGLSF